MVVLQHPKLNTCAKTLRLILRLLPHLRLLRPVYHIIVDTLIRVLYLYLIVRPKIMLMALETHFNMYTTFFLDRV